ncbi:hypothetical protein DSL64_06560 [Dyadobacter luteus]|jgi:hypothetical protein|uniref:ATP-grasp domain-containing protein n=1 Tax=Dyadobacter luteus TaxID=2259619 RepID=A0A3D8YFB5_9BACT|nr:hypothetical protein [Dyadobacter luteus]REA63272.1 hypothetical protein DSL64_06560 [Dyadobacter luteus]
MNNKRILAVPRNKKFSPNHIGNDDAIFSLTKLELEKLGGQVDLVFENEFLEMEDVPYDMIFTMARQKEVVKKLQDLEQAGVKVVNSAFGIENCFRTNMTNGLVDNAIPYPKSYVVSTDYVGEEVFDNLPGKGFWIKRGDFHAIHKEDVTFAYTRKEAKEILKEYALREIPDAVISEHLVGDLVKFYGVYGTDFFFWFYPYDNNHHKYSEYETINGKSLYYEFDEQKLQQIAGESARVLGIDIYGGDAIVGAGGTFHIIDLNDWPSFAPCRDEAAGFIAQRIFQKFSN